MIGFIYTQDQGWHIAEREALPEEYDGPISPRKLYVTKCGLLTAYQPEEAKHSYPDQCGACHT